MDCFKVKKFSDENIVYGFFSRNGGLSKCPYDSLNCSYKSGDDKLLVNQNIFLAQQHLNLHKIKMKFIKQVHGTTVEIIDYNNIFNETTADGCVTQEKDICLAILTADCAPIFLYDRNNHLICAIHSGWKGCLNNIVAVAINKINKISKNTNDILAIIGPCLNQSNFEVDENFKKKFLDVELKYNNFFVNNKHNNKIIHFNMRGLIDLQLQRMSINRIYHINKDTYSKKNIFFSHRRSNHADSLPTGRMINIIGFKQ